MKLPQILSVGTGVPEHIVSQDEALALARKLFSRSFKNLERLLSVFHNGQIKKRHIAKKLEWYEKDHSFSEKNAAFIESALGLCKQAVNECLREIHVDHGEISAVFLVCTSGLATPSLDARLMNELPFSRNMKRIPIWGLGCAGGAAGLSRAFEYCRAFPDQKVLVVAVELCSLTFQKDDVSKSNLIGTSLFSDGAAAVLIAGDQAFIEKKPKQHVPFIIDTQSTLLENSLDVMGWDIKDNGLYVVFAKSIPALIESWLEPNVNEFLDAHGLDINDIDHFIAHPGGKKVISAYEKSLGLSPHKTADSLEVLENFGNMSSPTVLFILKRFMEKQIAPGEYGLIAALGPGFSSEMLLVRWK